MSSLDDMILSFNNLKRDYLNELYLRLKKDQRELFNKLYFSISKISDDEIDQVIRLCERTLDLNIHLRDEKIDQAIDGNN